MTDDRSMNADDLRAAYVEMKRQATLYVLRYAALYARKVPFRFVNAACAALGEISIDEATATLDQWQREQEAKAMNKWLDILKLMAPIATLLVPGGAALAPLVPLIITAIGNAQESGKPGAAKKAQVLKHTADAVAITNQIAGKQILDPALTLTTASAAVDAIVDAVNSVHRVVEAMPEGAPMPGPA